MCPVLPIHGLCGEEGSSDIGGPIVVVIRGRRPFGRPVVLARRWFRYVDRLCRRDHRVVLAEADPIAVCRMCRREV